jgi:hypothetical protein
MTYRSFQILGLVLVSAYAAIGILAHGINDRGEYPYPFFSWFLFIYTPAPIQHEFSIIVNSVNDKPLSQPAILESTNAYNPSVPWREYRDIIQILGSAIQRNDDATIASARQTLEAGLRPGTSYTVINTEYDPILRVTSNSIINTRELGTFRKQYDQ